MERIHQACTSGNKDEVRKLLEAHPEAVSAKNSEGWTPLELAVGLGYTEIAALLIDRGANVNARSFGGLTASGWTPLHLAAFRGHREVAALLIDRGANIGAVDNEGHTALSRAVAKGHSEVAALDQK